MERLCEIFFVICLIVGISVMARDMRILRPVRIYFLRRQHEQIMRVVDSEMQAQFGDKYQPSEKRSEDLFRYCLHIEGLDDAP